MWPNVFQNASPSVLSDLIIIRVPKHTLYLDLRLLKAFFMLLGMKFRVRGTIFFVVQSRLYLDITANVCLLASTKKLIKSALLMEPLCFQLHQV